jgi:hypothetical protein
MMTRGMTTAMYHAKRVELIANRLATLYRDLYTSEGNTEEILRTEGYLLDACNEAGIDASTIIIRNKE